MSMGVLEDYEMDTHAWRALVNGCCQCGGSVAARRGQVAPGNLRSREVFFIDADVEAGLLKLLLDVNLALLYEGQKVAAKPGDLCEREPVLGDIDGVTGEVGGGGGSLGWGRGCGGGGVRLL